MMSWVTDAMGTFLSAGLVHVPTAAAFLGALSLLGISIFLLIACRGRERWERARRRELEAYCALDLSLPIGGDPRKLTERAKRICRLVTERSVFARAAVFLLSADGHHLSNAGSCGMDDLTLEALEGWCDRIDSEETQGSDISSEQREAMAATSFAVRLTDLEGFDGGASPCCATATLVPLRLHRGRLVGLLAVCAPPEEEPAADQRQEALSALELLAQKLARTIERALLMERLIQVERLAGAGHLVAGVAQELVQPLRMVLDCSELISGTATEPRVREHALSILTEARRMHALTESLRDLWKPRQAVEEPAPEV